MRAYLKNYRQSPRKVRLVADILRGKSVSRALASLAFLPKKASGQLKKLLMSAIANAKTNNKKDKADLFIKEIYVNEGPTLKRFMPRAMGRATRINKRTSHISIILEEQKISPILSKNLKPKT